MRFLKSLSIIAVVIFLCLLCSCAKGESNLKVQTSPSDKSLIELATRIYEESQLLEIVRFSGSLSELNARYPIECLREDSGIYRVSYLGDGSVAVLLFGDSQNRLLGNIYKTDLLKSDFGGLLKGQLLEEVRAIDPNGEYLFLFTGRNDTPKVSSHYTKDGYLITIEYNAENIITNITAELI